MRQTWDRLGYFRRIADRIEAEPALLSQAIATADRWLAGGVEPRTRIMQWRDLLERSVTDRHAQAELLRVLREDSEEAEFLREFAPVPGILSKGEAREFYRECAYSH
jgi:hypothetical protein